MRQASKRIPESAEKTVRDIRRATRRHHSAEEKIRIVLEGLRGEEESMSVQQEQSSENRSNLPFSCFPRLRCRFAYGRTRRTRRCEAQMRHCLGPPPQVLLPSTPSTRRKGRPPWPPVVLL
jgi:transposase